jgi:hypothetical protein
VIAEVVAFVAMVVAITAPICGHQNQPWPLRRPTPTKRRVPAWAHTQPHTYEEAA